MNMKTQQTGHGAVNTNGQPVNPVMVKLAREARGLSQSGLARLAHCGQPLIWKIEIGATVTPRVLCKIAKALAMPEAFFFQTDGIYDNDLCERYRRW